MNLNKKLLWSAGALLPLVVAPVAVVASCATTVSLANALAEALVQSDNISFGANKGTYNEDQLNGFKEQDATLKNELAFKPITGFNYDDFELETTEVDYDLAKTTIQFQVKIKNKKDPNDVAITKIKTLTFTKAQVDTTPNVSAAVKAKVETANQAFKDKSFKIKENLALNGADLALLNGLNGLDESTLGQINADILDYLFAGVVKGEETKTILSVAKFVVQTTDGTKANAKNVQLTLQLKYSDASGDQPTSALSDEFVFDTSASADISADNIFAIWDIVVKQGWLKWSKTSFPKGTVTKANFINDEITNFQTLKSRFFPSGWTYSVNNDTFNATDDDAKKITKVKFAFSTQKGSDAKVDDKKHSYELEYQHSS